MATAMPASDVTAVKAPKASDAASESRVDHDSHFNGLYETKQNLRIEGVAEGEIQCDGTLTVAEGARVKAKVTASTVNIAGELEGEVVCRDVFQIMPSGQVEATVSARRLIVHEGGFYNGEFHMIADGASAKAQASMPAAKSSAGSGKPQAGQPAGDDGKPDRMSSEEWWAKMAGGQPSASEPDKPPA